VATTYQTEHEDHLTLQVDPSLAIQMALVEVQLLRLETDIALAQLRPVEEDSLVIRDLSPLGR
jgi:hypothetical protein